MLRNRLPHGWAGFFARSTAVLTIAVFAAYGPLLRRDSGRTAAQRITTFSLQRPTAKRFPTARSMVGSALATSDNLRRAAQPPLMKVTFQAASAAATRATSNPSPRSRRWAWPPRGSTGHRSTGTVALSTPPAIEVSTIKATVSFNSGSTVAVSAAPNRYIEVATADIDAGLNGSVKLARIDTKHVHFNDEGHSMSIDTAGDTIAAYDTFAPTGVSW